MAFDVNLRGSMEVDNQDTSDFYELNFTSEVTNYITRVKSLREAMVT